MIFHIYFKNCNHLIKFLPRNQFPSPDFLPRKHVVFQFVHSIVKNNKNGQVLNPDLAEFLPESCVVKIHRLPDIQHNIHDDFVLLLTVPKSVCLFEEHVSRIIDQLSLNNLQFVIIYVGAVFRNAAVIEMGFDMAKKEWTMKCGDLPQGQTSLNGYFAG